MNHSSLFTFEESSDWDPKVIMKRLIVPQDQLTKLNSIPGWAKVQDNQNTLRLDKDFSIENSQPEFSANVTQNNQRVEKNIELFDKQAENRKSILETYEVYRKKLTRSLSFFTINKSCENLSVYKTLKRALSLQSVSQLSDATNIDELKNFIYENFSEKNIPSKHSESRKAEEIVLNKEVNLIAMETVPQLHVVDIPNSIENTTLYSGSSKKNNDILPAENVATELMQLVFTPDQPTKHIETVNALIHSEITKESNVILQVNNDDLHSETTKGNNDVLYADNADLHSETTPESNDVLLEINTAPCSNNVSDESAKTIVNDFVNVDNCISSVNKFAESHVLVSDETYKSDKNDAKEITTNKIAMTSSEYEALFLKESMKEIIKSNKNVLKDVTANEIAMTSREYETLFLKETMKDTVPSNYSICITDADVVKFHPKPLQDTDPFISECLASSLNSAEKIACKNIVVTSVERSNDMNLSESCPSKSSAADVPAKELLIPEKVVETTHSVVNSVSDMKVNDMGCNDKTCGPKSSGIDETAVSKKRKLESRNKRSKRLKSEEKQGNLKIRSIKKVGEICYSAEEVKTMLDIMKQLL